MLRRGNRSDGIQCNRTNSPYSKIATLFSTDETEILHSLSVARAAMVKDNHRSSDNCVQWHPRADQWLARWRTSAAYHQCNHCSSTVVWPSLRNSRRHSSCKGSLSWERFFHDVIPRLFSRLGLAPWFRRWRTHLKQQKSVSKSFSSAHTGHVREWSINADRCFHRSAVDLHSIPIWAVWPIELDSCSSKWNRVMIVFAVPASPVSAARKIARSEGFETTAVLELLSPLFEIDELKSDFNRFSATGTRSFDSQYECWIGWTTITVTKRLQ